MMSFPGRQAMLVLVTRAHSEYDAFSEIYAVWTDTSPAAQANRDFYVETYLRTEGPVVELGVGDGRRTPTAEAGALLRVSSLHPSRALRLGEGAAKSQKCAAEFDGG